MLQEQGAERPVLGEPEPRAPELFADLREGKTTYPLIVAREKDPALDGLVRAVLDASPETEASAHAALAEAIDAAGGIDACRALAADHAARAIASLDGVADGPAKHALVTVAQATVHRER